MEGAAVRCWLTAVGLDRGWRADPRVHAFGVRAVEEAYGAALGCRGAADRLVSAVLGEGRYFARLGGAASPEPGLGVSASHEGGRTYVAFATRPVAIDACLVRRCGEIRSAAPIVFSPEEAALLDDPWRLCQGWTTLECLKKLDGSPLTVRKDRPAIVREEPSGRLAFRATSHFTIGPPASGGQESVCLGVAPAPGGDGAGGSSGTETKRCAIAERM